MLKWDNLLLKCNDCEKFIHIKFLTTAILLQVGVYFLRAFFSVYKSFWHRVGMCFIVVGITRRRQEVLNKSCILFYIFCPFRLSYLHDKRKITYKSSFSFKCGFFLFYLHFFFLHTVAFLWNEIGGNFILKWYVFLSF